MILLGNLYCVIVTAYLLQLYLDYSRLLEYINYSSSLGHLLGHLLGHFLGHFLGHPVKAQNCHFCSRA
jgi:membrane protein YqaA with SNARE-associated domain